MRTARKHEERRIQIELSPWGSDTVYFGDAYEQYLQLMPTEHTSIPRTYPRHLHVQQSSDVIGTEFIGFSKDGSGLYSSSCGRVTEICNLIGDYSRRDRFKHRDEKIIDMPISLHRSLYLA